MSLKVAGRALRCDDTDAGQAFIERMKRYITAARKQNSLHQRCEDY